MTQIERRQARIRSIHQQVASNRQKEYVMSDPNAHHHIGVTENQPIHIGSFLQAHAGDPAIKVSWDSSLKCQKVYLPTGFLAKA
jgi:hypothetical protein